MSVFNCKVIPNTNPVQYIHSYSPDFVCFKDFYFIHGIFAVIASAFFVFICMVVALIYFECNDTPEIKTAKYLL